MQFFGQKNLAIWSKSGFEKDPIVLLWILVNPFITCISYEPVFLSGSSANITRDVTRTPTKKSCQITKNFEEVLARCQSYQERIPTEKPMTMELGEHQHWGLSWLLWRETKSSRGEFF
jgi:hypothetical protein